MTLVIDESTVARALSMPAAIAVLREAYGALATGQASEAPRSNLLVPPDGFLRVMAAAWPARGVVGYKEMHRFNGRATVTFHLIDVETSDQLAVLSASHLTALRTGACGGLATDLLAAPDAAVLGVIGAGSEARSQIAAVRAVRPIRRIQIYSRTPQRREALCAELGGRDGPDGFEAVPVGSPEEAVAGAPIVVAATHSTGGLALAGESLTNRGVHVTSVGSTLPAQREIDPEVFRLADRVVFDAEDAFEESGDVLAARQAGTVRREDVELLGDVVAGGRRPEHAGCTLYKSVGSAIQDLALAVAVYEHTVDCRGGGGAADLPRMPPFQTRVTVAR